MPATNRVESNLRMRRKYNTSFVKFMLGSAVHFYLASAFFLAHFEVVDLPLSGHEHPAVPVVLLLSVFYALIQYFKMTSLEYRMLYKWSANAAPSKPMRSL